MNHSEQVIREYVNRFEEKYPAHSAYDKPLEQMARIGLKKITERDVDEIIEPFLYGWGRMGRVLGKIDFGGWQSNLAEVIRTNCHVLEDFRTNDLASVDLCTLETQIAETYGSFKNAVGKIASAKVLHLICPRFFPLWDNDIANGVRAEIRDHGETGRIAEDWSGEDYYRFMEGIKLFMAQHEGVLCSLASQYQQGKLRVVDEFLWWGTHRPLSLFF